MTTEYEAAKINGDLLQAQQMMASAETYLLAVIEQQARQLGGLDTLHQSNELFQAQALFPGQSLAEVPESSADATNVQSDTDDVWRFCVLPDVNASAASSMHADEVELESDSATGFETEPSTLRFGLQNESAKLNLLTVLRWDEAEPGRGRRSLLQISGMTDEAADGILDWIDADDEPREFGAEAEHYQRLDHPYRPRNGMPETLEELLFVKGVARDILAGSSVEEFTFGDEPRGGRAQQLTLHSAERNSDSTGMARIRLNSGSVSELPELEQRLQGFLSEDVARYILLARLFGVSYSTEVGIGPLEVDFTALNASTAVPITNLSDLVDSSVLLPATAGGQRVNSPLTTADMSSLQTFAVLEDRVTTETTDVLSGRININHAGEEVLRALTDDPAAASQIVQQRQTIDPTERQSTLWLLTRQIVDMTTYRRIHPHVTTGGHVYSGEIIVYRKIGGPFLRRKVTIDAANESARRLNWLDKSAVGLPVGFLRRLEGAER